MADVVSNAHQPRTQWLIARALHDQRVRGGAGNTHRIQLAGQRVGNAARRRVLQRWGRGRRAIVSVARVQAQRHQHKRYGAYSAGRRPFPDEHATCVCRKPDDTNGHYAFCNAVSTSPARMDEQLCGCRDAERVAAPRGVGGAHEPHRPSTFSSRQRPQQGGDRRTSVRHLIHGHHRARDRGQDSRGGEGWLRSDDHP